MGLVIYLIFAFEHPFVGALSVKPDPYVNVLQIWREDQRELRPRARMDSDVGRTKTGAVHE
jgi:hypothetical protein